ncbi:retrovirus-related pol polyprotein from transposon TNT 1-94 [Tanacetum coccineum]
MMWNMHWPLRISSKFFQESKFFRQPYDDKKNFRKIKEEKREDRRCFKCGDLNHFISDCPKNSSGDQKAFVVESWRDSGDDSKKEEICLMAHSKQSGYTRHMTGNKDLFSSYKPIDGGNVLFGSNTKSKIIGKGTISHNSLTINDVSHVENISFNLLSIGQICDKKYNVLFSETGSKIIKNGITLGKGIRKNGLYIMKTGNSPKDVLCLTSIDLVRNLPKLNFEKHFCNACNVGKQVHESHKAKNMVSTSKCLELLHMDLFGPSAVQSYGGNFYTLVIVDDYSRYTWTRFLKHKNEAFDHFEILSKKIQNQKGCPIISIRTDHGREFDNEVQFGAFCDANGITHNFSAPRTPQSNGVVERKNRTLQEMSRTLLNEQSIPQKFWCNAVDTSTYILNRILIRPFLGKTPYELFKGRKPNLEYFKVFGSKCSILNTKDYLTKFDPKSTKGIFLGYSPNSKAYVVLNKETMKVKESLNVKFDETPPPSSPPLVDDDLLEVDIIENQRKDLEVKENEPLNKQISNIKESKDHPLETIIGNLNQRTLRSQNFFSPYQPFSPPSDYTSGAPPTSPIISPPLSPITINSNENCLLTPKSTPPPLTTPPPAPTQPSKLTSPVAINLDPIELLFSTPLSSLSLLYVLGDLPPSTTNPSTPRPSFATIKHLENEPPPIPPMDSYFPSPTPELEPTPPTIPPQCLPPPPPQFAPLPSLGPNNPFPLLTHEMFFKESIDFKIEKFENASKDLDSLLGSQRLDNDKNVLGFNEYSAVPPPPAQVYSPPMKDLSRTGLPEFVDDTVTDYSRPTPNIKVSEDVSVEQKSNSDSFFKQGESSGNVASKPKIRNTSQSPRVRGNQRNWNNQKSQQLGNDFMMHNKAYYICGSFDHLEYTCKQKSQQNGQREEKPVWNNAKRVNHQKSPRISHPNPKRHMVPRKVLTRSGLISLNTARQSNFNAVCCCCSRQVTARPKAVVNAVRTNRVNAVKASTC